LFQSHRILLFFWLFFLILASGTEEVKKADHYIVPCIYFCFCLGKSTEKKSAQGALLKSQKELSQNSKVPK